MFRHGLFFSVKSPLLHTTEVTASKFITNHKLSVIAAHAVMVIDVVHPFKDYRKVPLTELGQPKNGRTKTERPSLKSSQAETWPAFEAQSYDSE